MNSEYNLGPEMLSFLKAPLPVLRDVQAYKPSAYLSSWACKRNSLFTFYGRYLRIIQFGFLVFIWERKYTKLGSTYFNVLLQCHHCPHWMPIRLSYWPPLCPPFLDTTPPSSYRGDRGGYGQPCCTVWPPPRPQVTGPGVGSCPWI